jgi:hypothetical protein
VLDTLVQTSLSSTSQTPPTQLEKQPTVYNPSPSNSFGQLLSVSSGSVSTSTTPSNPHYNRFVIKKVLDHEFNPSSSSLAPQAPSVDINVEEAKDNRTSDEIKAIGSNQTPPMKLLEPPVPLEVSTSLSTTPTERRISKFTVKKVDSSVLINNNNNQSVINTNTTSTQLANSSQQAPAAIDSANKQDNVSTQTIVSNQNETSNHTAQGADLSSVTFASGVSVAKEEAKENQLDLSQQASIAMNTFDPNAQNKNQNQANQNQDALRQTDMKQGNIQPINNQMYRSQQSTLEKSNFDLFVC